MQDEYAGFAGTFIVDSVRGIRVPIEQWQAEQDEQAKKPKPAKDEKPTSKSEAKRLDNQQGEK